MFRNECTEGTCVRASIINLERPTIDISIDTQIYTRSTLDRYPDLYSVDTRSRSRLTLDHSALLVYMIYFVYA